MRIEKHNRVDDILADIRKDASGKNMEMLLGEHMATEELEDDSRTFGQKAADKVADFVGSWAFIISFLVMLLAWIFLNGYLLVTLGQKPFDPFPFILLNLVLSCIAAIQAPLIMMSQNRQADIDRQKAHNDFKVNLKTEIVIEELYWKLVRIETKQDGLKKQLEAALGEKHPKTTVPATSFSSGRFSGTAAGTVATSSTASSSTAPAVSSEPTPPPDLPLEER